MLQHNTWVLTWRNQKHLWLRCGRTLEPEKTNTKHENRNPHLGSQEIVLRLWMFVTWLEVHFIWFITLTLRLETSKRDAGIALASVDGTSWKMVLSEMMLAWMTCKKHTGHILTSSVLGFSIKAVVYIILWWTHTSPLFSTKYKSRSQLF